MNGITVERVPLLQAKFGNDAVTQVNVRRMTAAPRQEFGPYLHPCPVIGYIVSGAAYLQFEGQPAELLPVGPAFHEPARKKVLAFGNASDAAPMTFVSFSLSDGDQNAIVMLPPETPEEESYDATRNLLVRCRGDRHSIAGKISRT